jgi:hypothetical protein
VDKYALRSRSAVNGLFRHFMGNAIDPRLTEI